MPNAWTLATTTTTPTRGGFCAKFFSTDEVFNLTLHVSTSEQLGSSHLGLTQVNQPGRLKTFPLESRMGKIQDR